MKAVIIETPGGPEVLKVVEYENPRPSRNEVLVKVGATALNRADLVQRKGNYPAPKGSPPDIPGLEFAGVVSAVGADVNDWKVGDRVMGLLGGGGYAEEVVTHERLLLPIPEGMETREAAAIPEAFLTAFDALNQLELRMGESVMIHAIASGVGTAALQIANLAGFRVIGTSRDADKLRQCSEWGLEEFIVVKDGKFAEVTKKLTDGDGIDGIVDLVGGGYFDENLKALAKKGRMLIVGLVSGAKAEADLRLILTKRLRVLGTVLRSRPLEEKIALTQQFRKEVLRFFDDGLLRPVVDSVYHLEEAAQAHQYMEENQNIGKIILEIA